MTIKYKVTEQGQQKLAKEISNHLGMPIEPQGENLRIDIFTLTKDGTLVYYEEDPSVKEQSLFEHLHDCGYEVELVSENDEKIIHVIAELQSMVDSLALKVAYMEKKLQIPMKVMQLRQELGEVCKANGTRQSGMEYLVRYYMESLNWTEEKALQYAIDLFHNGTIQQIRIFNKDGVQL